MAPTPKPEQDPTPAPAAAPAAPPAAEPDWAASLRQTIEELPGRLNANVSDDDKRSIAEQVHGLFESSGAFTRKTDDDADTDVDGKQKDPSKDGDDEPQQGDSLARRWFGRH